MNSRELYNMKLFSVVHINQETIIRRVPGGWVHETVYLEGGSITSVFIPYSDEFKPEEEGGDE